MKGYRDSFIDSTIPYTFRPQFLKSGTPMTIGKIYKSVFRSISDTPQDEFAVYYTMSCSGDLPK